MAGWYIKIDEDKRVTEVKERGRGRPPRDFIFYNGDSEPGIGMTVDEKDISDQKPVKAAAPKAKKSSLGGKKYDVKLGADGNYERDSEDSLIYKVVNRGRCAAGWVRMSKEEFLELLSSAPVASTSTNTESKSSTDTESKSSTDTESKSSTDTESKSSTDTESKIEFVGNNSVPVSWSRVGPPAAGGSKQTQVFQARKTGPLSDLQDPKVVTFHNNPHPDDEHISMIACDFIGRIEDKFDFLHLGQATARIDVHKATGDLKIWVSSSQGEPDYKIEGAIVGI